MVAWCRGTVVSNRIVQIVELNIGDWSVRANLVLNTVSRVAESKAVGLILRSWQLQDSIFLAYIGVIIVLLLSATDRGAAEQVTSLVALQLLLASVPVIVLAMQARWPNPLTHFLRWWYPLLLCTLCFGAIGRMLPLIQPQLIDAQLVAADLWLFGAVLTPLLQESSRPWLTELMYLCYASYYFIIPGVGFALYLRQTANAELPSSAFRRYILTVSLTFWVCYLHFLLTPAGGPIFWPSYPGPVLELAGGPITIIERWVFQHGTIVGGAFPSSHVAVAFVCAYFAVRFSVAPLLLVPLCVGLAVSTVYAGYHYGVDVLYGMIIGAVVTFTAGRLFEWHRQTRPSGVEGTQ